MKNNWYVITGAPSCGKTMLISALDEAGIPVQYESARIIIDEDIKKGKTIEEIREDEEAFQHRAYQHKFDREKRLSKDDVIFFDRGMHDTTAFMELRNFAIPKEMEKEIRNATYKKVFLLEPVEFEKDYARTESPEEALRLHNMLGDAYRREGLEVVEIPAFETKQERIEYFLEYLRNNENVF